MNTKRANDRPVIDYTNKDYASLRQAMLDLAGEKLPEWSDHAPNDLGVLLVELFAYMGDILLYYQDRIANESYLDTAVERRSLVNLLRLTGYELRPPQAASADLTLLFSEPDPEDEAAWRVHVPKYTLFKTKAEVTGEEICFRYIRDDLEINLDELEAWENGGDEDQTEPATLVFQYLPVVQVDQRIEQETLGSSDGAPHQRFRLAAKPLLDGTLELWVNDTLWQEQLTLLYSLSADKHFIVRRDEKDHAWIEFGDGKYGEIPPRGSNNITAAYLVGGGVKGNVPAGAITEHASDIDPLLEVFNEKAATGGTEHEPLDAAAKRGPSLYRAMRRAVTARDYEAYALQFGVAKARARATNWNQIDLFVAPVGGGSPTDTLRENLRKYFEDKRMVTSLVEVRDPVYPQVFIEGELDIEPYFLAPQVQQQVENAVRRLLAFDNVDFGGTLYRSKVYEAVEAVEGVAGIDVTRFERAETEFASEKKGEGVLSFDWNEIPVARYPTGIKLKRVEGGHRAR